MTIEQKTWILADKELNGVIQRIKDDQWDMKLPEWFQTGRTQPDMTLKTLINYHAYDDIWVPETLAGKTIDEVGKKYDGDLLGADPKASFADIVAKSVAAVEAIGDINKIVHLSYGDFPAHEYLRHTLCFRGFRVHDLSRALGLEPTISDELIDGLAEVLTPVVEDYRKMGVFPAALEVPADASKKTKLLALVGRE